MKQALEEASGAWRFASLAGGTVGLLLAPLAMARPSLGALSAAPLAVAVLTATRPRHGGIAGVSWLVVVALVAAVGGLLAGGARLHAIDAGALRARPDTEVMVAGNVAAVPRRYGGEVSVRVDTAAGRVLVVAREPVPELPVGSEITAEGVLEPPEPWRAGELRRHGIAMALRADELRLGTGRRGGLAGRIDTVRRRAELALGRGMPEAEEALARGFVLGEDDRIDPRTRNDFKRSGLAHLLAVSGENVILLCLLAWPLLALLGLTLRARLIGALVLVAIYVPVTGAGASIQRAGAMGAAGLVAALASRPRSRWYVVLLAAAVTLAANPRAAGDVGWQLSFAAVLGILLWSSRLASALAPGAARGSARRAVADGVAVTVSATVATAPLMAHHFEAFSLAALPANVLALPAVAPAMWLGMLAGIAGQLPWIPVEPVNWLDSLCLAYIGQIAHWLAVPNWALLPLRLASPLAVAAAYCGLLASMELGLRWLRRRSGLGWGRRGVPRSPEGPSQNISAERSEAGPEGDTRRTPAVVLAVFAAAAVIIAGAALFRSHQEPAASQSDELVVRVLDVGQGDSILLDPPDGEPVLVDTGPPGSGVASRLRELGVESLAAVVVSHDQSDHSGGLGELLSSLPVERLVYSQADPALRAAALGAGATPVRLAEGGEFDSGALRLTALWPPRELLGSSQPDRNLLCLVLVADWHHFSMLLPGDAEAEAAPIDPGPVDVLKVAHHGSEDEGLGRLLDHAVPKLAVVSVGDDNSYGHPTPETLGELRSHDVPTLRTDENGEVEIEAGPSGWRLAG